MGIRRCRATVTADEPGHCHCSLTGMGRRRGRRTRKPGDRPDLCVYMPCASRARRQGSGCRHVSSPASPEAGDIVFHGVRARKGSMLCVAVRCHSSSSSLSSRSLPAAEYAQAAAFRAANRFRHLSADYLRCAREADHAGASPHAHCLIGAQRHGNALRHRRRAAGDRRYGLLHLPPAAAALPKIGGFVDPDVEKIVALQPDLVVGANGNPPDALAHLAQLGIPVMTVDPQSLEQVEDSLRLIGRATGDAAEANAVADSMRATARRGGAPPGHPGGSHSPAHAAAVLPGQPVQRGAGQPSRRNDPLCRRSQRRRLRENPLAGTVHGKRHHRKPGDHPLFIRPWHERYN